MSRFVFGATLLGAFALTSSLEGEAQAQFGQNPFASPQSASQPRGSAQGGALALPPSIKNVVSIDAHNMLLAQVEETDGSTNIVKMRVDHVYSGGVARTFGGSVVPTAQFVTPGFNPIGNTGNTGIMGVGGGVNNGFNGGFNNGGSNGSFTVNSVGVSNGGFNSGGFNGGFTLNSVGPNTTVSGTGIFAPWAQTRK